MSLTELVESVEFVVDAQGNKKAVLVDLAVWQEMVRLLANTAEEIDDMKSVPEQTQVRLTTVNGHGPLPGVDIDNSEWISTDRDYNRFPDLKWWHPLED